MGGSSETLHCKEKLREISLQYCLKISSLTTRRRQGKVSLQHSIVDHIFFSSKKHLTSISISVYHFVVKTESSNMGEIVAEAFLTVAFEKLFELLASPEFRSFFHGKKSIDDQLGLLNEKLKTASLLLNDAENRQITDEKVKEWLDDLKDVIFRADDLVEEIKAEARSKQELESGITTSALKRMVAFLTPLTEFDKTVRGEIENSLKALGFLLERASTLRLKHTDGAQNTRSLQRSPAPLLEESYVHGRDIEKEEILKMLLSDEIWGNKIGVLPIVGMGGLGKTTLARLVYEDDRVKKHDFQPKAWVTVSTDFDIFRITKIILQQVSGQTIKCSLLNCRFTSNRSYRIINEHVCGAKVPQQC